MDPALPRRSAAPACYYVAQLSDASRAHWPTPTPTPTPGVRARFPGFAGPRRASRGLRPRRLRARSSRRTGARTGQRRRRDQASRPHARRAHAPRSPGRRAAGTCSADLHRSSGVGDHARGATPARAIAGPGSAARFVRPGDRLDLFASVLPGALHDPRHGALQAVRFLLNLLEHRLWEVEALLPLAALREIRTAFVLVVRHGWLNGIVARAAGASRENSEQRYSAALVRRLTPARRIAATSTTAWMPPWMRPERATSPWVTAR